MRTRLLDAMDRTCAWIDFLGKPGDSTEGRDAYDRGGRLPPGWSAVPVCPDCGEPHPWTHDDGSDDEQPY